LELQGVVLFRNPRLVPEPASTVNELLATAQALRQSGQCVGASFDFGFLFSGSQLAVCGGGILDEAGELAFRREIGLCWLDLLYTLGAAGPASINTNQDLTNFELASSAWLIDTADKAPRLARTLGESGLNIDPWPQHETGGSSLIGYMWTENIYLVANAAQGDLEAAWAFATYLTTPGMQLMLSDPSGAGHLPVVEAAAVESAIQAQAIEAISHGLPFPLMNDIEAIIDFLERSVELVVMQGGDPAGALYQAVRGVSRVLDLPLDTP
jgi:ABC-type glycerol-3-phosphate transport system substrate-binding protein